LEQRFNAWYPPPPRAVLIPAKRQLELVPLIAIGHKSTPRGDGVVNYLFFLQNRPPGSPEHSRFERIVEAVTHISSGYRPGVFVREPTKGQPSNQVALSFCTNGTWRSASDCGLGLQELLLIVFFALEPAIDFVAIEETETHLHPEMQKRLLHFLRTTERQYLLSTHSSILLNNAFVDRVFMATCSDQVSVQDVTSRASALDDMGYEVVDNLVADLTVLVEGPTDVPVWEELLLKCRILPAKNVRFWPLGGDIMDKLDLGVLGEKARLLAVVDGDPGSAQVRKRFIDGCKARGIHVHQLERYAIENYFSPEALNEVFGSQVPVIASVDPNRKLYEQIGIDVKKNNRKLARATSWQHFAATDLADVVTSIESSLASI
jgi:hypothetical protein